MATITWVDKTDATTSALAESQKVTATTMAEIKSVVNTNAGLVTTNAINLQSLALRSGAVPGVYTFSSSAVASDPGAGFFRFDNANPKLATHLYISESDANINIQNIMNVMVADSFFFIADREDATKSGLFKVISSVDNTTWYDFTISVGDSAISYNSANTHAVQFLIKGATGAGSGTVTSVGSGSGMNFTAITATGDVTMGTPTTLTKDTTNAVSATSHQHALDLKEEGISGTRLTDATVTGSQALDWDAYKVFEFTLTGNTTITDSNLPTGTATKVIEMVVTGDFTLTFPAYYEALPSNDSYDGTKRNHIVITCIVGTAASEDVIYSLQNLTT